MSNLLVIGAAGRTGRHVVDLALERGHTVTALARPHHDLTRHAGIARRVSGDATDPDVLADALRDQDAVIMAVGSSAIVRTCCRRWPPPGCRGS